MNENTDLNFWAKPVGGLETNGVSFSFPGVTENPWGIAPEKMGNAEELRSYLPNSDDEYKAFKVGSIVVNGCDGQPQHIRLVFDIENWNPSARALFDRLVFKELASSGNQRRLSAENLSEVEDYTLLGYRLISYEIVSELPESEKPPVFESIQVWRKAELTTGETDLDYGTLYRWPNND